MNDSGLPSTVTKTPQLDGREADEPNQTALRDVQRAEVSLMVAKDRGLRAKAEITNGGLLSIAVLVSSILLSTAVIVRVATDARRRR
jgi:hypothetical protein